MAPSNCLLVIHCENRVQWRKLRGLRGVRAGPCVSYWGHSEAEGNMTSEAICVGGGGGKKNMCEGIRGPVFCRRLSCGSFCLVKHHGASAPLDRSHVTDRTSCRTVTVNHVYFTLQLNCCNRRCFCFMPLHFFPIKVAAWHVNVTAHCYEVMRGLLFKSLCTVCNCIAAPG